MTPFPHADQPSGNDASRYNELGIEFGSPAFREFATGIEASLAALEEQWDTRPTGPQAERPYFLNPPSWQPRKPR